MYILVPVQIRASTFQVSRSIITGICRSPHLLCLHSSKLIAQKLYLREREKTCGVGSPTLTRGICRTWLYGVEITEGIRRVWRRSLWRLSGIDNGEEVCTGGRHSGNRLCILRIYSLLANLLPYHEIEVQLLCFPTNLLLLQIYFTSGAMLDGVEILSTTTYASTLSTQHSYFAGHIAYFVRRNVAGYILV
ncbi:hypothetical protein Hanom_Chr07g00585871 [Helianthus anomalus]